MNIERRRRWIEEVRRQYVAFTKISDALALVPPPDYRYASVSHHRKRLLSLLRRLRRCPECRGKGTTPGKKWTGLFGCLWMEYQVFVEEECPTCKGTGRL